MPKDYEAKWTITSIPGSDLARVDLAIQDSRVAIFGTPVQTSHLWSLIGNPFEDGDTIHRGRE